MVRVLPSLFEDAPDDDKPTVPGVSVMPEWVLEPAVERESGADPVLEDPSSWDEVTKRFRLVNW
jgi:hypothetical protein